MKAKFSTAILVFMASALVPAESFAHEYAYTDTWSSPAQRAEWSNELQKLSETPVWSKFHMVGHLHALSYSIRVPSVDEESLQALFPAAFLALEMEATQGPGCP